MRRAFSSRLRTLASVRGSRYLRGSSLVVVIGLVPESSRKSRLLRQRRYIAKPRVASGASAPWDRERAAVFLPKGLHQLVDPTPSGVVSRRWPFPGCARCAPDPGLRDTTPLA